MVLGGACELKHEVGENVGNLRRGVDYIRGFKEEVFSEEQVRVLVGEIERGRLRNSRANRKRHVAGLRGRN